MANRTIFYFTSLIKSSDKLSDKEKDILTKRAQGKTLQKIGKRYKVTGEWIRQKEEKAIKKFMEKISQLMLFERN